MAINININFNKIKNLPTKLQVLIFTLPALLFIILFVVMIFLPKNTEIKNLNAKITKLNQEIASSQEKVKILDKLIEENKLLKAKLESLKEQLPEEKEVSVLLKQISELGLQSGLEVLLWRPEAKKTSPENLYVEIPVKVEVLTAYHNLGVFFSHISRLPRLVNISDIDLSIKAQKGKEKDGLITAAFTARTFASVSTDEIVKGEEGKDKKEKK
ncbi:MAG: type 4a pilus biogenesis protein PilO [Nitrospirae bacterium]|nr:type 4a pilus biogenesis protein PilO [Nitrospirota bacterium]